MTSTLPPRRRGDVCWGTLDPRKGSEQAGTRPVLIVQDDRLNRTGNTYVVAPFTTSLRYRALPTCVFVLAGDGGLARDSVALCHQVRVLDKRGVGARLGTLSPAALVLVEAAPRRTLGL